ncbi:hypothetical protein EJ05DRAFT_486556 [Pseudovirgaria hyperparasitica]|uniref:Ig-like domain-containing protein n=1 Tax=Pseudovirgaria hyperparasitica TaxID=470096 RepID=A0A6A6W5R6_9PEZI|nr:uncharacterized protein EJ05DRAFT_486556 [Pseudovirgaria hyperparasitica]KAF2757509.1 hypothetical protein EJ05DRAFT_486556 [Pseudovirgaria hyperparasitica]
MARRHARQALFFSLIASFSLLPASLAQPILHCSERHSARQPNCHCTVIPHNVWLNTATSSPSYLSSSPDCQQLASKLERWREHDAHHWETFLSKSDQVPGHSSDRVGASSVRVLGVHRPSEDEANGSDALRQTLQEGVVMCRPTQWSSSRDVRAFVRGVAEMDESWQPSQATFVVGAVLVLALLGVIAEVVDLVLFRSGLLLSRQPIMLTGSEKIICADGSLSSLGAHEEQVDSDEDWPDESPII